MGTGGFLTLDHQEFFLEFSAIYLSLEFNVLYTLKVA